MKKLILLSLALFVVAHSHPFHGEEEYVPKKKHMHSMGMMHMMMDEEMQKIVNEHMKRCKKTLMKKLMQKRREKMIKVMLNVLVEDPETFKSILKENPELRERLSKIIKEVGS